MKKLFILFAACAMLAACDKKDESTSQSAAPAASSQSSASPASTPAAAPAAPAAPQASAASSELPKECDDYVARVKACVTKAGGAAAQFDQALEQSKAQWNAVSDKSQLVAGCKAANDQFGQMAAALKCE
ncbi:membrane-bound lytic murein transglycosylase B [Pseudomonas nitritireducens]|uniref:Membrane-bound lytic murein transglycosylase B n=1 Tax=Pseudomonas nitroreducens TaxID=46680 RepID=A0A7W7KPE4_PSENT|nr:DUF5339 family protein [Pseudomonas nitritireducens]MBB4866522.1 membrane-bound lytic murein transglycosylase B [Pseudomonas nitritireducens]